MLHLHDCGLALELNFIGNDLFGQPRAITLKVCDSRRLVIESNVTYRCDTREFRAKNCRRQPKLDALCGYLIATCTIQLSGAGKAISRTKSFHYANIRDLKPPHICEVVDFENRVGETVLIRR